MNNRDKKFRLPQSGCLFEAVRSWLVDFLCRECGLDAGEAERIELTPSRSAGHGDMATNAALLLAGRFRTNPRSLALQIAARIEKAGVFKKVEVAGPGFINFTLDPEYFNQVLRKVLAAGASFWGQTALGRGRRVNVEYVSANPTGPLHVGHCRGAVVGDALARLMQRAGYEVTREYYINDAGNQVEALAWAAYWRYLEAIGRPVPAEAFARHAPSGLQYQGEYLKDVGEALKEKYGASLAGAKGEILPASDWFEVVREMALEILMQEIRRDLEALGISFDQWTSERKLLKSGAVEKAISRLERMGLLYTGCLPPPKGKLPDDWEERPQTLFRATRFGDDVDRALQKSDGTNTYFANDIAYHVDKADRSDILIDVLGADHGGYVSRMKAAVAALTEGEKAFEAVICQIVRVVKNGEPVRMSKRAGTFVTLRDLLDEVGSDAIRFTMLTRRADAQMDFDLDAVVAQTRDNPVFYVQYAHARCRSVLRHAEREQGVKMLGTEWLQGADLSLLASAEEREILKRLAAFPRIVDAAAATREPHRIATYCIDLAADFHALWNRGREETSLRFVQESDPAGTRSRLALVQGVATGLAAGLSILGVEACEEMR